MLRLAFASPHHPGRPQRFAILGKAGGKVVGWSGQVGFTPIPEFTGEGREVFQAQVAVEVRDGVTAQDFLLDAHVVAEDCLGVLQGGRGNDEALRLDEPDPELVVLDDRVGCHGYFAASRSSPPMASMRRRNIRPEQILNCLDSVETICALREQCSG